MASEIQPALKSIGQYFDCNVENKKRQLIIPEFQRAYSWTEEQCEELWNDVHMYFESCGGKTDIPYFFGCIILSEEEKPFTNEEGERQNTTELKIIDGQQRTITFLLLLKAFQLTLYKLFKPTKEGGSWDFDSEDLKEDLKGFERNLFGILYRDANAKCKKNWDIVRKKTPVIKTNSINENKNSSSDLYKILRLEHLEDAENDKSDERVSETRKQGLSRKSMKRFSLYYRNFKFFCDTIDSKLANKETLKKWLDFLLNTCQIIQIISKDVGQAISMFNALNSKGMNLSDSDLVCSYLAAKANDNANKIENQTGKEINFENKWSEFVESVYHLQMPSKGRNTDEKEAEKRKSILNQYMYYVRACDGETDSVISVRDYYNKKIEKGDKSEVNFSPIIVCNNLIKISQIWEKILKYSSVSVLLKINNNAQYFLISYLFKYDINEITKDIVDHFAENLLRLFAILRINSDTYSKKEFKTWLFQNNINFVNNKDIEIDSLFNDHINNHFNKDEIKENLLGDIDNSLIFLKEYLYAKKNGIDFSVLPDTEIEHIMPQSGSTYEDIPEDAGLTKEEFELYLNKLGNKILLEANINKRISNGWFKRKKESKVSDRMGYINSQYPIALSLVGYKKDQWQKEDIDNATDEAMKSIMTFIFPNYNYQ